MKSPPKINEFDIVKDSCFTDEKTNFRAQMAEMERMGLAPIDHHPVINEADRSKLYMSMFMNSKALIGIANKVQFDIRLYFFPRCMEYVEKIRKTDLRVHTDPKTLQKMTKKKTTQVSCQSHQVCYRRIKKKIKINIQIYMH